MKKRDKYALTTESPWGNVTALMMTLDLNTLPPAARPGVQALLDENQRLAQSLKFKDEIIRLLNARLWGPKSEKLSPDQMTLLLGELVVTPQEVEQEASRPEPDKSLPKAKAPRGPHAGRDRLPEQLERREQIVPCCPEDCRCARCGAERPIIGYEVKEELVCVPASFHVRVLKREKRGSHCLDEQGVAVAAAPARIVPKGKLSDEFLIETLAAKFQQHLPVYRQCVLLREEHGIDLSRQTINDGLLAAADLLRAVLVAQRAQLLAGGYIQADETTLPCQTGEKTGKNHKAYLWEYSHPGGLVVFDFQMGRGREGPRKFLHGFRGKLQCDGYAVYDQLGEGIIFVACMAHIRREFVEAAKVAPQDPVPVELIALIGQLYKIERDARVRGLGVTERYQLRQAQSAPVMAALKTRITDVRQQRPPGSMLAKGCDYALGQWSRMEEYLKDGQLEIDNNWCEGAMRPVALGRKNWMHVGNEQAGPKIAAMFSIVETCRRLDIKLRAYLGDVLPKLADWPMTRVAELTPQAWKAAHAQ